MPEEPTPHVIIRTSSRFVTYSEQTVAEYSRLEVQVIQHLYDAGIIGIPTANNTEPRYSDDDLTVLRRARRLYDDLGVNLEGIEIILRLSARLDELQRELARHNEPPRES